MPRLRKSADAYHHGALRDALLRATVAIVRKEGVEAVTLRKVAARAGVSEAAPYHHFQDKNALLVAAAAAGFARLAEHLDAAVAGAPDDPEEQLVALAGGYVRFAIDERGAFRMIFGAHVARLALDDAARAAGRAARERILAPIRALRSSVDAMTLYRMLWGQAHGIAWLAVEDELGAGFGPDDAVELARRGARALLDGSTRR